VKLHGARIKAWLVRIGLTRDDILAMAPRRLLAGPVSKRGFKSTSNYVTHLRRVASGLTTVDSKKASIDALTKLPDAQRFSIEQKQKDWILKEDVRKLFTYLGSKARERVLKFPMHLRHKLEDANPMLFSSARDAIALEDSIDVLVCELLNDISRMADEGMQFNEPAETRSDCDASPG
jgi:hypothetical protein